MRNISVAYINEQMQDNTLRNDVLIEVIGNQVFCPMCEIWHENNTLCQMSWSD